MPFLSRIAAGAVTAALLGGIAIAQQPFPFGGSLAETRPGIPLSFRQVEERTHKVPGAKTETRESTICRDSQGRVRIETGSDSAQHIQIYDPVGGTIINIDPPSRTARRVTLPNPHVTAPVAGAFIASGGPEPKLEVTGQQAIEGIMFLGVRLTADPAVTLIRWIAPEIGLTGSIENSSSEWTYSARLKNLEREEPDPHLFTIPEDYKIEEEVIPPQKH